jgi:hypothetical protein
MFPAMWRNESVHCRFLNSLFLFPGGIDGQETLCPKKSAVRSLRPLNQALPASKKPQYRRQLLRQLLPPKPLLKHS